MKKDESDMECLNRIQQESGINIQNKIQECMETKDTKEFVIYAQGNKNVGSDYLKEALKKACELIVKICGGKYDILQ